MQERTALFIINVNQEGNFQTWLLLLVVLAIATFIIILLFVLDHRSNKGSKEKGITIDLDFLPFKLHAPRSWLFYAICACILGIISAAVLIVLKIVTNRNWFVDGLATQIIDFVILGTFILCLIVYIKGEINDKHVHAGVRLTAWAVLVFSIVVLVEAIQIIPWNEWDVYFLCILGIMLLVAWIDERTTITSRDYTHLVYLLGRVGPVEYRTDDQLLSDFYVKKILKFVHRHTSTIDMAKLFGMADIEGLREVLSRLMTFIKE